MQNGVWTVLTNYGRVIIYIAKHPRATTRQVSLDVGSTERAIQKIVADLEAGGYLARHKEGGRNKYTVHPELPMRYPIEREHAVGDPLLALGCKLEDEGSSL